MTSWTLKDDGKEPYSRKERQLFSLLAECRKPVSTTELLKELQHGRRITSLNERAAMSVTLNRLRRKVQQNRERFRVVKSPRAGPRPIFWSIKGK